MHKKSLFSELFYYHLDNICCKKYTHKRSLPKIESHVESLANDVCEISETPNEIKNLLTDDVLYEEIIEYIEYIENPIAHEENLTVQQENDEINLLDHSVNTDEQNNLVESLEFDVFDCIICGKSKNRNNTVLYFIEKKRSERLVFASRELKDNVFLRTNTVDNTDDSSRMKLKYHKTCLRAYEKI